MRSPLEICPDDPTASDALLRDQAGPLEDGGVLLDRAEAHRIVAGPARRCPPRRRSRGDDVAPRVLGKRAEHTVDAGRTDPQFIQPCGCFSSVSSASRPRSSGSGRGHCQPQWRPTRCDHKTVALAFARRSRGAARRAAVPGDPRPHPPRLTAGHAGVASTWPAAPDMI
jgi:hypothetical protein